MRKEEILNALPYVDERASFGFVDAGKAGAKRIKKAVQKFGHGCAVEEVIALMDTSLFHSGKEGFLLTTEFLCGSFIEEVIYYNEIEAVAFDENEIVLSYKDGKTERIWANIYANYLVEVLKSLVTLNDRMEQ